MEAIGGYFGLELRNGDHYHQGAIRLNTARNCLEYILRAKKYSKIYIPYYTCEVLLEPINKLGIAHEYYSIDIQLEPLANIALQPDEAFLYTNYFGLKQNCVEYLSSVYGKNLIIDNAQAFYAKPISGIDTFYSARKFFGVPDGAYLYTNKILDVELEQDSSYERVSHLFKRIDLSTEDGYIDFKNNDEGLCMQAIKKMSKLTEALLSSIDYENIGAKRRRNYLYLNNHLSTTNHFFLELRNDAIPMVYPYFTDKTTIRTHLIENKIYTATYWSYNIDNCKINSTEYNLAQYNIPLSIDQRYGEEQMQVIINHII